MDQTAFLRDWEAAFPGIIREQRLPELISGIVSLAMQLYPVLYS
jgi:hypothetical protein